MSSQTLKRSLQVLTSVAFLLSVALAAPLAHATAYYWDIDGANPGAGGATPSGTWSSGGTTWSTDSTGGTATGAVTTGAGDNVTFSAGSDATGSYTVNLSGNQTAGSVTFEDGTVTIDTNGNNLTVNKMVGTGGTVTTNTQTGNNTLLLNSAGTAGTVTFLRTGVAATAWSEVGAGTTGKMLLEVGVANAIPNGQTWTVTDGGVRVDVGNGVANGGTLNIGSGATVWYNWGQNPGSGTINILSGGMLRWTENNKSNPTYVKFSDGAQIHTMEGALDWDAAGLPKDKAITFFVGSPTNATSFATGLYMGEGSRLGISGPWMSQTITAGATGIVKTTGGLTVNNVGFLSGTDNLHLNTDISLSGVNVQVGDTAAVAVPRRYGTAEVDDMLGNSARQLIPQNGKVWFEGSNNTFGRLTVASGTAQLGDAGTDAFTIAGTATVASGATLDVHTYAREVGSIAGAGSITLGTGGALTAGGDNASTEFSGVIKDAGSFAKKGGGTLTLSNSNTYTGTTDIKAGMILVKIASAFSAGTAMMVRNGATLAVDTGVTLTKTATWEGGAILGGNGTYDIGATFGSAGIHIAPGTSVGTLTVDDGVDLSNGGYLDIEVSGLTADLLQVTNTTGTGNLTLGGTSALNVQGDLAGQPVNTQFTIATFTGSRTGTFSAVTNNGGAMPGGWYVQYNTHDIKLLPEPATMALLVIGGLGMLIRRRRA